jgi:TrmH family RNA methyltransferase
MWHRDMAEAGVRHRDMAGAGAARFAGTVITSLDNPRVKEVVRLRTRRERRRAGLFLAEGPREVERARAAGLTIVATYYAPALVSWPEGEEVSERVLAKMAYRADPEGVLAVVEAPRPQLPLDGTLYLAAVGIEKPGNIGAMARTAAAAGADALVVADARCDPWNPNAIRASTGAVFTLPVVEATLDEVRALPARLVAATPHAATAYTDADLALPATIAVGAEDRSGRQPQRRRRRSGVPLRSPPAACSSVRTSSGRAPRSAGASSARRCSRRARSARASSASSSSTPAPSSPAAPSTRSAR